MFTAKYLGHLFVSMAILLSPLTGRPHAAEPSREDSAAPEPVTVEIIDPTARGDMSYADAAATALAAQDDHTPQHYKEITGTAIAAGWLAPKGKKPELSLYAAISNEIKRQRERGESPRFFRAGKGYFGLAAWQPKGIRKDVAEHNRAVHTELLDRIKAMPPDKFEELVGDLLVGMGLDEVEVTAYSGDGGIDVRGVFPFGGVANIKVAVQVKRYSANVQRPEIQKLRGSLDEHDYGFFITTSDFSSGAKEEAERTGGGKPIVLVNGRQVVNLLMEYGIGVTRSSLDVYELDENPSAPEHAAEVDK
jgi:restriction system protein